MVVCAKSGFGDTRSAVPLGDDVATALGPAVHGDGGDRGDRGDRGGCGAAAVDLGGGGGEPIRFPELCALQACVLSQLRLSVRTRINEESPCRSDRRAKGVRGSVVRVSASDRWTAGWAVRRLEGEEKDVEFAVGEDGGWMAQRSPRTFRGECGWTLPRSGCRVRALVPAKDLLPLSPGTLGERGGLPTRRGRGRQPEAPCSGPLSSKRGRESQPRIATEDPKGKDAC